MKRVAGGAYFSEVRLPPDQQGLPCRAEVRPPKWPAALTWAMGIGSLALALLCLKHVQGDVMLLIACVSLIVVGMIFGVLGLYAWTAVAEWDFTEETVAYRSRGIFGREEWEEPLWAYSGVVVWLPRAPQMYGGFTSGLFYVDLKHTVDRSKDVRLYHSRVPTELLAQQERYARLFGLPAITTTATGEEVRQPGELGTSLRERAAAPGATAAYATKPPRHNLAVQTGRGALLIRTRNGPAWLLRQGAVLGVVIGVPILIAHLMWVLSALDIAFALGVYESLVGFPTAVFFWPWHEQLLVSAKGVRYQRGGVSIVPAEAVEDVIIVRKPLPLWRSTVQIRSAKETISFGRDLSKAEKEWVRQCVVSVLTA